jgi:hypothetical protein
VNNHTESSCNFNKLSVDVPRPQQQETHT